MRIFIILPILGGQIVCCRSSYQGALRDPALVVKPLRCEIATNGRAALTGGYLLANASRISIARFTCALLAAVIVRFYHDVRRR